MKRGDPVPRLACLDPGVRSVGVSIWERDELAGAYLVGPVPRVEDIGQQATTLAAAVREIVHLTHVLVECPRVYPGGRTRNPNDLLDLSVVVGALCASAADCMTVEPRDWKGQRDGDAFIAKCVQPSLMSAEFGRVELRGVATGLQHNIWDAVGLGLWYFGRLRSGRVLRGAT